ncbi:MAG: type II toxin-antitoxin system RelE/ParE family toxin [Planctomycetes bacterium]|nr:type II toxin-antitoxin system RelE/ParE family toxin [Planctomycetota bacterium]
MEGAVRFLLESPLAGRLREFRSARAQGVRSWPVRDFPNYLILYRPVADDIEVIRFLHGARDLPLLLGEGEAGATP